MEEVDHARSLPFNPSMFGDTLKDVFDMQLSKFPHSRVPWILSTLAKEVLSLNAKQTEGIFRCVAHWLWQCSYCSGYGSVMLLFACAAGAVCPEHRALWSCQHSVMSVGSFEKKFVDESKLQISKWQDQILLARLCVCNSLSLNRQSHSCVSLTISCHLCMQSAGRHRRSQQSQTSYWSVWGRWNPWSSHTRILVEALVSWAAGSHHSARVIISSRCVMCRCY